MVVEKMKWRWLVLNIGQNNNCLINPATFLEEDQRRSPVTHEAPSATSSKMFYIALLFGVQSH